MCEGFMLFQNIPLVPCALIRDFAAVVSRWSLYITSYIMLSIKSFVPRGGFNGPQRGGGGSRRRGRGHGRGRGRSENVSVADLDADLDKFHSEAM